MPFTPFHTANFHLQFVDFLKLEILVITFFVNGNRKSGSEKENDANVSANTDPSNEAINCIIPGANWIPHQARLNIIKEEPHICLPTAAQKCELKKLPHLKIDSLGVYSLIYAS